MDHKAIHKARTALVNAGSLADRNDLRSRLVVDLRNDIDVAQQGKDATNSEYRRQLERWRTEAVPKDTTASGIASELADARLYRLTGAFALLAEMGLAAWVFWRLGVGFLFGILAAVLVTLTLHGALLQLFNDPDRPKATVFRLRKFALLPALLGFLVALGLGVLARYVGGWLALTLLPLFSFALWLATISLMVLAASLFTMAHLLGWSRRYERQYRALDNEERASRSFLKELDGDSDASPALQIVEPIKSLSSAGEGKDKVSRGIAASSVIFLAICFWSNVGCSTNVPSAEGSTATAPHEAIVEVPTASLHVMIDTSGSCVRSALNESWETIKAELPQIIETQHANALTLWSFDEDGWCPKRVKDVALPTRRVAVRSPRAANEWEDFANIREAVREVEGQKWANEQKAEEDNYFRKIGEALAPLDTMPFLPEPSHESRESDPVGLLKRISQTREKHPQFFIVLTDLADTKHKELPAIAAPEHEVHVLVLLAPAEPKDALITIGKPLSGPAQFDLRSRQLQQAVPWVAAAPYFARNIPLLFKTTSLQK